MNEQEINAIMRNNKYLFVGATPFSEWVVLSSGTLQEMIILFDSVEHIILDFAIYKNRAGWRCGNDKPRYLMRNLPRLIPRSVSIIFIDSLDSSWTGS